jgi:colicin import membrane protein
METNSDRALAVAGSLVVHGLVIAVLYLGLLREPELQSAEADGPAIEATLVSAPRETAAAIKRIQTAQPAERDTAPAPQPLPEPKPQDAPKPPQLAPQAQLPKPDTVDQDEVRRAAELAAKQKLDKEQEERHKQDQIDLSRKQEQLEAENRQRQAQQQLEKDKELADIRKKKADADRQVKILEEKSKQLADQKAQNNPAPVAPPQPAAAGPAVGTDTLTRYKNAIKRVVIENWQTAKAPGGEGVHCKVTYTQSPGGVVFKVQFGDCPFDAAGRQSVEEALERSPLPYTGFESVFSREGTMDLCYPPEEKACAQQ